MELNIQQLQQMVGTMNEQIARLNQALEESAAEIVRVKMMTEQTREAVRMGGQHGGGGGGSTQSRPIRLIDHKMGYPEIFKDDKTKFRRWANRVMAYCNGMHPGYRKVLKWCQDQDSPLDQSDIESIEWDPAVEADVSFYDLLQQLTDGMAQATVTCADGDESGFEAWRKLVARFDPQNAMNDLERVRILTNVQRCKKIDDVMYAVEKWEKNWAEYIEKSGHSMPEVWKTNAIMGMIPIKNKEEIELRYVGAKEIKYTELRMHVQNWAMASTKGSAPMPLDNAEEEETDSESDESDGGHPSTRYS